MSDFTYYNESIALPIPMGIRPGVLPIDPADEVPPPMEAAPGYRTIPKAEWNEWINAGVNTSYWVWSVFNQGSVGSCASESVCGGLKVIREAAGLPRVEMNPWGIYGRVNGGSDRGSTLSSNLNFLKTKGAFPESVWPRSKGWQTAPSQEAYAAAADYRIDEYYKIQNWDEFASAMLLGWSVYWGYSGHAIVGCDLLNDKQFRYLNSWGNWGSASPHNTGLKYGFGTANSSSILWGYGAYAFRTPLVEI